MNLNTIHNVYFVGIGGIGMSALARYFSKIGKNVFGYDKIKSPITDGLEALGVSICFIDDIANVSFQKTVFSKENTLVVYTPAIKKDNRILSYFLDNGFNVVKRAKALGVITKNTLCMAVAGTHGKTTTSSILGHIMQPQGATAFLGGITENYNSNLILGADEISVVEADEFDRSFLQLHPDVACITSMDADHLDIYGEHKALVACFKEFSDKVSKQLIIAKGLPLKGLTYAVEDSADYMAENVRIKNGAYIFDLKTPSSKIKDIILNLPGRHNVMNALAAIAMADVQGVSLESIKAQLLSFKGVQRRFSYKLKTDNVILIDDYAHHPSEIKAVYSSVREMYPEEKVLAVFQPHLYSRTNDFENEFADILGAFDELMLLDIYPARELPIEGVTSSNLLEKVVSVNKILVKKENLVSSVLKSDAKIILMLGAGDIGLLVEDVVVGLRKKI